MHLFRPVLCFLLFISVSQSLKAQDQAVKVESLATTIHGSLLVPEGISRPPVVLIIAGSGPTDRNGNQQNLSNNSLKQLADSLCGRGIASLRYDKRGVGESRSSGAKESVLRFEHFVEDARQWVSFLGADRRFSKVLIAGHSEGALIGMLAASGNPLVKGYISIAGAARPADEMIREQITPQPEEIKTAIFPMLDTLKRGDTLKHVPQYLFNLFRPGVQPFLISWFKYDPSNEIRKLTIPVLLIQGTTDIQVLEKDAESLAKAYPKASVRMVQHMNHVLKEFASTDRRAQITTYSNPDLPLHPELIPAIAAFIGSLN